MNKSVKLVGAPLKEPFVGGNGCWVECSESERENTLIQKTVINGKNACWMPFEDVTSDRCILQKDDTPTECAEDDYSCQYQKCDGDDKCEQEVTQRMRDSRGYSSETSVDVPKKVIDAIKDEAEQRLKDLEVEYTELKTSAESLSKKTDQVLTAAQRAVQRIKELEEKVKELEAENERLKQ